MREQVEWMGSVFVGRRAGGLSGGCGWWREGDWRQTRETDEHFEAEIQYFAQPLPSAMQSRLGCFFVVRGARLISFTPASRLVSLDSNLHH